MIISPQAHELYSHSASVSAYEWCSAYMEGTTLASLLLCSVVTDTHRGSIYSLAEVEDGASDRSGEGYLCSAEVSLHLG